MKRFTKTHYTMRKKAGNFYKKWVEIKAFANTLDVLKVDRVDEVLPQILEVKKTNAELFKHMNNLLKVVFKRICLSHSFSSCEGYFFFF